MYFCKHFNRKSLASAERWSGMGGWDFVVPIWKRAATWKKHKSLVTNKWNNEIQDSKIVLNHIYIYTFKIGRNYKRRCASHMYLLILLAPRRFSSSHFDNSTSNTPYVSRAKKFQNLKVISSTDQKYGVKLI